MGNRTEQTNNDLVAQTSDTETHTYGDINNRLIGKNGTTQTYDQVGNIIGNGTYGFNYEVANRMAEVTQGITSIASCSHNALGQRVSKTHPNNTNAHSTAYLYNPAGQLISETTYDNAGIKQETKHYVWLGTVSVAILQTIKAGQPAANDDVDGDTVATVINLRFPGQYYDAETILGIMTRVRGGMYSDS